MKKLVVVVLTLCLALGMLTTAMADRYYYIGQHVWMGTYEQDNNYRNGREAIEWRILDIQGNQALLISEYGLDCQLYHNRNESMTWANCSVRSWLNGSFMYSAFNYDELNAIVPHYIPNDSSQQAWYNGGASTTGGHDTYDSIFLLSYGEAMRYFHSNYDRKCRATAYANASGALNIGGYTYWLTRSPGYRQTFVTIINSQGENHGSNTRVNNDGRNNGCVRPAMWVNMSSGVMH